MAILESATPEQIQRLLELFPASTIKEEWPGLKGQKKVDACEIISKTRDVERIKNFVTARFSHCRQHVLLLENPGKGADFRSAFPPAETISSISSGISFDLSVVPYTVYLLDPMEETNVDVIWPLRFEVRKEVLILRSIVLERDPSNYSGRPSLKSIRDFDEKHLPNRLQDIGYMPLDINKGVKSLWSSKYMDAFRVSFKKEKSTSTEIMDEEKGLRENAPEIFNELTSKPLLNTNFRPDPSIENAIGIFQINASMGRIGFTSYADNPGDSDEIIEAILANN